MPRIKETKICENGDFDVTISFTEKEIQGGVGQESRYYIEAGRKSTPYILSAEGFQKSILRHLDELLSRKEQLP